MWDLGIMSVRKQVVGEGWMIGLRGVGVLVYADGEWRDGVWTEVTR